MFQIFIRIRSDIHGGRVSTADVLVNLFSYTAALGNVDVKNYQENFNTEAEARTWISQNGEKGISYFIVEEFVN